MRARTSSNLVALPGGTSPSPRPPNHLTEAERALFLEVIATAPPKQFTRADTTMLAAFAQASLLARTAIKKAARDPVALKVWREASRVQVTLATKLRLTVQARKDPATLARNPPAQLSAYDARLNDD